MSKLLPLALVVLSLAAAGCASRSATKPDPRDPFERINRATFAFNDALDRAIAKPVARGYRKVTPDPVERGVSNFMDNAGMPVVLVNDLLQGKFVPALHDTGRFLLNTTIGLAGIFDPATKVGLQKNEEDFGQTLGRWGLPPGPYLMVPLLGPSTIRDGVGTVADEFADPRNYIEDDGVRWGLRALRFVDTRARLLDAEQVLEKAYDRYAILRSVYLQRRAYLVSDGEVPEEEELDPEMLEEESGLDGESAAEPTAGDAAAEDAATAPAGQPEAAEGKDAK